MLREQGVEIVGDVGVRGAKRGQPGVALALVLDLEHLIEVRRRALPAVGIEGVRFRVRSARG